MKSKNEEGDEETARLASLSPMGALLEGASLEAFKNLKIRLDGIEGDLYAKVIESSPCKLRFTAVPPAVERFIKELLEKQTPASSSELAERD
jgi:hypothetical protein